jgi:hypothetical protein
VTKTKVKNTPKPIIVKVAVIGAVSSPKKIKKYSSATRPESSGAIIDGSFAPMKVLARPIMR